MLKVSSEIREEFSRGKPRFLVALTVGEMIDHLSKLPRELPMGLNEGEGWQVTLSNYGKEDVHCYLSEYREGDDDEMFDDE